MTEKLTQENLSEQFEELLNRALAKQKEELTKELAASIVAEQKKEFLSFDDICMRMGLAKGSPTARKIVEEKDFPLPTAFSDNGHRRWFTKDFEQWAERRRIKRSNLALAS